jgi:hypothetical protein
MGNAYSATPASNDVAVPVQEQETGDSASSSSGNEPPVKEEKETTSGFGDDFSILRRASDDDDFLFQAEDMDAFEQQVVLVLQRFRVPPESALSKKEQDLNEELLYAIDSVCDELEQHREESSRVMLLHFRKSLTTPANLKALLCMIDADIYTGKARCFAIHMLKNLWVFFTIWTTKINDGSSFSDSLLKSSLCKFLDDEANEDRQISHAHGCVCGDCGWVSLTFALGMTKEEPTKVLDCIHSYDWKTIFENTSPSDADDKRQKSPTNADSIPELFSNLHRVAVQVLQPDDPDNEQARDLLETLGSCHQLFRRVMRSILLLRSLETTKLECYLNSPSDVGILQTLKPLDRFLFNFHGCLVHPPSDHESQVLVRLANHTLKEFKPFVMNVLPQYDVHWELASYDLLIFFTDVDWWAMLKDESAQERWKRFEMDNLALSEKQTLKDVRKAFGRRTRKSLQRLVGNDEMCANCFVLKKDCNQLFQCGWCHRVNYCSRECQKQHWTKTHETQCTRKK